MNTRFRGVCEAAAAAWAVPAIAVGVSIGDSFETLALGCEPDTRFRIASVTKPLTATLALALLGVDEAVRIWPEDVRVHHLLSHTSGFDCELPDGDNARFGTGDDALEHCVGELPAVQRFFSAGEVWSYANTGYWLAGCLAAERAGSSYEDALARHVLQPAGLGATSFALPDLSGTGPDALPEPYPRSRRPSGGLTSTAPDLLRFGRWHLAQPESAQMRVVCAKPTGGVYGLGLAGERVGGLDVWGHGGSYGGFQSSFLVVPDRDAVFVGLTNGSKGTKALRQIEDVFFDELLGDRRREPPFRKLSAAEYEEFAGVYENTSSRYEVTYPEGSDGLLVTFDGDEAIGLALDERTFQIPVGDRVGERFDFPREGFGRFSGRLAERVA
jgi:D-alanyl-D-alanine carboxypeptidase